ncbi:S1 family peptidase [Streptomyces sp. HNM0575]|uniref:S1 family peptidase n=1 Tax=Streptomyces sp. HNM0575 TaxID=2716338 RepID=UPI00145E6AF7|nr:S1 family peptidase [Streptomyces sp. HNM0575]NLU72862.1 S1 family peptidase [Streptomyces sp. HNM0575]
MPRKLPVLAAAVLTAGALGVGVLPATAGEPHPPGTGSGTADTGTRTPVPEIAPGMLKSVSKDLGITMADARLRLVNEQRAVAVEKKLRKKLGSDFGGAWVTGATSKLVVATTDSGDSAAIKAEGAQSKVVRHSLTELERAKSALDSSALRRSPRGTSLWGVDVRSNSVFVRAGETASAKDFLTRSGASASLVQVTQSAEKPRTYDEDLRGGDAYYTNGTTGCSIGFPVTKGSTEGFVTAGHCGKAGSKTTGRNRAAQGTVQGAAFPDDDYAWVAVNDDWRAKPYVKGPGAANLTVAGSTQMPSGSSVCRSGATSGWRCGTVEQHDVTVTYEQGTVRGLTRTSVCAEPGDSGGPFLSGDQAQGTTSGGSGDCSTGGTTYFQPVTEPLAEYGLTLSTD